MFFQALPSFLSSICHMLPLVVQLFASSHSSLLPVSLYPRSALPHALGDWLESLIEDLPPLTLEMATSLWALLLAESSALSSWCSSPSSRQSSHLGTEKRGFVASCVGAP